MAIVMRSRKQEYTTKQCDFEHEFDVTALRDLIEKSSSVVCVVDVEGTSQQQAAEIFRNVRSTLEKESFSNVNIMCLVSGHGEATIHAKLDRTNMQTQRLVMWSWTAEEVYALSKARSAAGLKVYQEGAFAVCGGSVRHLFDVQRDQGRNM